MAWYAARRFLASIPVIAAEHLRGVPHGHLLRRPAGRLQGSSSCGSNSNPAIIADRVRAEKHFLRLDQPVLERYWLWIKGIVLHGDFGPSRHVPDIGAQLGDRLLVTARLLALAMLLAVVLALVRRRASPRVRRSGVTDHALTFVSIVFLSLPVFWFAVLLKDYLAVDLNTAVGTPAAVHDGRVDAEPHRRASGPSSATRSGTSCCRRWCWRCRSIRRGAASQRTSMVEVLDSDYVRLARAKGLPRRRVLVHHALRTALIPLATVVAVDFAGLVGSTVITEQIFTWQGMGTMLLDGIRDRDVYVVLAWLLVVAVVVVVVNLISDLLYAVLDPRIRVV